jgi:hypothetical protein
MGLKAHRPHPDRKRQMLEKDNLAQEFLDEVVASDTELVEFLRDRGLRSQKSVQRRSAFFEQVTIVLEEFLCYLFNTESRFDCANSRIGRVDL